MATEVLTAPPYSYFLCCFRYPHFSARQTAANEKAALHIKGDGQQL